jgi:PiT family inorganic phosphate transporter
VDVAEQVITSTVRNLALAWVLALPAAILLAGSLFWLFSRVF